jgi:hypothetical protein
MVPLFGKEGLGEILLKKEAFLLKSPHAPLFQRGVTQILLFPVYCPRNLILDRFDCGMNLNSYIQACLYP